jgi:hypothetical protein
MNRYILIRRLRGPAFVLLVGVNALLDQAHILSWGKSWPLYLILAGVLLLAERAALAADGYPAVPPPPGMGAYPQYPAAGAAPVETPGSAAPGAQAEASGHTPEGGQE